MPAILIDTSLGSLAAATQASLMALNRFLGRSRRTEVHQEPGFFRWHTPASSSRGTNCRSRTQIRSSTSTTTCTARIRSSSWNFRDIPGYLSGMARARRWSMAFLPTLLLAPSLALASHHQAPPDSLGRDPDAWFDTSDWKILLGTALPDTLDAPEHNVLRAAEEALEQDDWIIDAPGNSGRELVTGWKPIHNFIFRLFAGRSLARCFASVTSMADGRTVLTFRGAIASRHDLHSSPMRGSAESSYRSAVAGFQHDVRAALARTGSVAAFAP